MLTHCDFVYACVGYQAGFSLGSGMTFRYLAARHMAGLT